MKLEVHVGYRVPDLSKKLNLFMLTVYDCQNFLLYNTSDVKNTTNRKSNKMET